MGTNLDTEHSAGRGWAEGEGVFAAEVPWGCQEHQEELVRPSAGEVSLEREQMGRCPKKAGSVMGKRRKKKRITPSR